MSTIRLTMAQALTGYLTRQMTEIDGKKVRLIAGVWAIFGHGNVAALGEALYQVRDALPTYRAHNEQAMAHAAIAFAKASFHRRMMAVTSSIGPGATNMVTAAAVAHVDGCRSFFCLATFSLIAGPTRSCSTSRISPMVRFQQMTVSARYRAISTALRGPSRS
jgi:TPP-dependent trihydroxycyclohexane-1,2-dione (THcHDO) dehydratase